MKTEAKLRFSKILQDSIIRVRQLIALGKYHVVSNSSELSNTIKKAKSGDCIELKDGTYNQQS
jgi:hypothetical protein